MESLTTPDRMIRIAVDLVNTKSLDPEALTSPADLERFLADHGEPSVTVDERDLMAVKAVRERLRPVFHAEPREAAGILNDLLADYAVRPYLSDHDESPWHLHVAKPGATWAEWMAAGAALGLAGFAAGHGFEAIDSCAAPDCERVFVNAAERRPRRFCTPTCSSRTRVASYRARQILSKEN
ncbi:CGNR zinc finger domain-containing protein [Kribbella qitaiheensis]|uniref:CGNR zinc finger domain-containing protein n=1 Tax=Kribbella qitaiheensis TaxID=1544730 RepID=A0A7G6WWR5_9ACTN|nr:CGNR zinc finger domain-containing protein [Kribbella qitaiheensis]QNE18430.1 CGNR zinc finger domain-containing protein [Kribbella qitaiheensis]